MGSVAKAVGGAVGKVAKVGSNLLGAGGKEKASETTTGTTQTVFDPISGREKQAQDLLFNLLGQQEAAVGGQQRVADKQAEQINNLFRNLLVNTMQSNGFASPEQIAQATQYVDETFTKPAQMQLERFGQSFQESQSARAAALGRQPDDLGYQRELFSELAMRQADIAAQRGAMVQQRADELAFQRPMQQAQLGMQGAQFFNQNAQRLFGNRVNLANIATQQQQLGQQQRMAGGRTTQTGNVQQIKGSQAAPGEIVNTIYNTGSSLLGNLF